MTPGAPLAQLAYQVVQLDGGEWCVEFLGHAFVADPEPTQKDAAHLVDLLRQGQNEQAVGLNG